MARYGYERLSSESASCLELESSRTFAHTATTLILEPGPLATPGGGVDFAAIRRGIASRLHRAPRYRQRLKWIPLERHPVWVDDHEFNLDYHLRHTSLPRPGGREQLKKMSARIKSQRLDRARPLWECWVVEGLEDGRFAVLMKSHHAMIDRHSTEDLLEVLLSPDPADPEPDVPPYRPRPVPSAFELMTAEIIRQARLPRRALEKMRAFAADRERARHELSHQLNRVALMLGYTLRGPAETPLNGRLSRHRRFDHLVVPFQDARTVQKAMGGTVNDVVLATVAGAVRTFLGERLVNPATLDFRIATAVSFPSEGEGNEVDEWILELPVWEKTPEARLRRIREQVEELNRSQPALPMKSLARADHWSASRLLTLGGRAVWRRVPVNMTVVNVPGPQQPFYLLGSRLVEAYGQAPLRENNALGISVLSYDGKLFWGVNADFDRITDLDRFTAALAGSFRELLRVAARDDRHLEVVGGT